MSKIHHKFSGRQSQPSLMDGHHSQNLKRKIEILMCKISDGWSIHHKFSDGKIHPSLISDR